MKLVRKARMTAEEMIETCEEYCNYYSQKLEAALQRPRDDENDILVRACADKHNVLHALLNYISDEIYTESEN